MVSIILQACYARFLDFSAATRDGFPIVQVAIYQDRITTTEWTMWIWPYHWSSQTADRSISFYFHRGYGVNEGRGISQLFGTRKTKTTPRPHYALIIKTIIWYGSWYYALQVPWYIHTLHIDIHTIVELLLPEPCSDGLLLCLPEQVFPRIHRRGNARGRIRSSAYCPVCMYVCMYSFEYSQPAGKVCQFIRSTQFMHDSVSNTETAVISCYDTLPWYTD